ncbi:MULTISPECIES: FkbM family methyltransferase [unclassified Bradyrhizobium]
MAEKNQRAAYKLTDSLLRGVMRRLPPTELLEKIALWWGYRFQPGPRVSRLRSGALFQTTHTDYLQLLIYYLGTFEPHCLPYVRAIASEGDTVLDVGANIGFYTVESAAVVGQGGRVISIEAAPSHAQSLRRNIEINRLQNVSVFEAAVGSSSGMATLKRSNAANLGMFSLGAIDGVEAHIVKIRTIDDILAEAHVTSLKLIKMDIEGSEYRALLGAKNAIEEYRPSILIEINDAALHSCGSSSSQLLALLQDWGYRGWTIGRNSTRPINEVEALDCAECIFVHSKSEWLAQKLDLG